MNSDKSNTRQAMWLGIGQAMSFVIAFISAAILSRYFDKTEYGTYRQILYVYGTLQSIFTVGLPNVFSYFIPRLNKGQQKNLVNSMTRVFVLLGLLFSCALFGFSDIICNILNNPELSIGLKIFSPFPLFTLPALGIEGIYTALKKTKDIAVYQVVSKGLMLACILFPVLVLNTGYKGAIIGWGLASFISFLMAMYLKSKPYIGVEKEVIQNMYKTVFDYSLPLMGAFFAGFFISSSDQFFISRFFGTEKFAEYANGSISIPITAIISTSAQSVLLPIFSKASAGGNMTGALDSYKNAVLRSVVLIYPFLIFCGFYAEYIVSFLFGREYSVSGVYLRLTMFKDALEVLPYFAVLLGLGLSRTYFFMHLVGAVLIWGINYYIVNFVTDAYMIVAVRVLFYLLMFIFVFTFIKRKSGINLLPKDLLKKMTLIIIHSLFCGGLTYFIHLYFFHSINLFLSILLSGCIFYIFLLSTGKIINLNYSDDIIALARRIKQ